MYNSKISDFISSYVQKESFRISDLIETYKQIAPSAHPDCNNEVYSEAGMEYFVMRLPQEIASVRKVTITADLNLLNNLKTDSSFSRISCHKRKRLYFFSQISKHLVIGINSVSDVNDIVSILTGLLIEISKLKTLFKSNTLIKECFSSSHIEKLASHFGISHDEVSAYLEELSNIDDFEISLSSCNELSYKQRASAWGEWLSTSIKEKVPSVENVYVIFSNEHSVVNVLSSYTRKRKEFLLDWAGRQSRFKSVIKDFQEGTVWIDDALYYIQRAYFSQNGKELDLLKNENESSGILRFEDPDFNGPIFHLVDLARLDPDNNDSRIFDNAIYNIKKENSIIINIDFTMGGHQAYYVLSEILKCVSNVNGLYIFGKAGAMEGAVGDIILPGFTYDYYKNNYIFYNNDLKSKYIRRYLHKGEIFESHGMLTVPGVLLQNYDYLHYYYQQNLTGIEMEGGPFLEAIVEEMKKNSYAEEILHITKFPFDLGMAYYVSDTPYHEGKTLGTLGQIGLESVYALTISIINRILIKESCIEIS